MNYDSEIKVLMRDKDRLRNDNEALRNKVAMLEHELSEHKRTAAIVAGGMNRLADERDGLRVLCGDMAAVIRPVVNLWERSSGTVQKDWIRLV